MSYELGCGRGCVVGLAKSVPRLKDYDNAGGGQVKGKLSTIPNRSVILRRSSKSRPTIHCVMYLSIRESRI